MKIKTKNRLRLCAVMAIMLTALSLIFFFGSPRLSAFAAEGNESNFPPDPYMEGHTFVGWFMDEYGIEPYDGRPITEDMKVYAMFKINVYTVTFIVNGEVYFTLNVEYGTTLDDILLSEATAFTAIYMNEDMTVSAEGTQINADTILYAVTETASENEPSPDAENEPDFEIIQIIMVCAIVLFCVGVAAIYLVKKNKKKRKHETKTN